MRYLEEGEVRHPVEVGDLQVAVDDLTAGVQQPQSLIVVLQAGEQVQLHVRTQAH